MKRLAFLPFVFLFNYGMTFGQSPNVSGKATFTYETNKQMIPVALQTTDNNLSIIVKRAFRLHGGFKVVSDKTARFILRFEGRGSNSVRLGILPTMGGSPESFPVQGADLQQAALFAADTAVERLTKRPGFFAGRIVFVTHQGKIRELYTSDLFFKGYQKLTSHRHQVISPDWSPDGSRILYSSNHKGGMDILMLDVASRVPRTIASYRGSNLGATFDPYGRRAAMILNRELFINDSILNPKNKPRRLTNNKSSETSPSWSGDGRRMIISSDIKGGAQLFEVYLSGSNRGRLRHIPTNISRECTEPAWNPTDPNILAFTANIGGRSQIVIYNFQTRESRSLKSNTDDEGPSWTNDGRHLVFAALKGGAHQLHMLDTVTNKRTELHTSKSSFSSPDFVYPRRSR